MTAGTIAKPRKPAPAGGTVAGAARSRAGGGRTASPPASPKARLLARRIKDRDLITLCQHLSALAGSGIGLSACLHTFADETPSRPMRRVLAEIIADLEAGRKLSDALDRHPEQFTPYVRASIWAGEASGNMAETLDRVAQYLEDRQETRQRVRNAFAYPVVLLLVIVGVVTFLMLYVVPVFAGVYARMGIELPLATQMLMGFSQHLAARPWMPALPMGVGGLVWLWIKRTRSGRLWWDRWKIRLPIVGPLLKQMTLYRFARSFGEMMGCGVPVLEALNLAGRVTANAAFDHDLEGARAGVQRGLGLTEPLRRMGWFSPSLLQVISSGEQSGRVPALLKRAADILERDIHLTLKRVVGRVEPLLTVGLAIVVGLVLLAVYLPMFDVMQHVGQ
jgi:MSHA biogenesis protein MshG